MMRSEQTGITVVKAGGGDEIWAHLMRLVVLTAMLLFAHPASADTVNARQLGAAGDGVADDTRALQLAFDAVGGGGAVYIPAGRYRLTNALRVRAGTRVYGDGGSSELFVDAKGWKVETTDFFGMLTIKNASDVEVSSLHFRGIKTEGISRTPKFIYLEHAQRISIHDNQFEDSAFEGIWQGGPMSEVRDIVVSRNFFRNVGWPAANFAGLPAIQVNAHGAIISENTLVDVGTGIGASGSRISIANNRITGATVVGIGTGDNGPQQDITITGNTVRLASDVKYPRMAILVVPGGPPSDPVLVTGNLIALEGHAGHASALGIRLVQGAYAHVAGNTVTIFGEGVGIHAAGDPLTTTLVAQGNSVRLIGETGTSYGIAGRPGGPGQKLTVFSNGNSVTGFGAGSFSYDWQAIAGGDMSVQMRNDFAGSGRLRVGQWLKEVGDGGFVLDWPSAGSDKNREPAPH